MNRRKHFSLGEHLAKGQLPMFMTGKEIQTHLKPFENDRQTVSTNEPDPEEWGGKKRRPETNSELWDRKYDEATTNQDNNAGLEAAEHNPEFNSLSHDIVHTGFTSPRIPVNLNTGEILGGHHRVAVGAEEHPNYLFPVVHHEDIHDARHALKEHY